MTHHTESATRAGSGGVGLRRLFQNAFVLIAAILISSLGPAHSATAADSDDELYRRLLGGPADEEKTVHDPLGRAIQKMHTAGRRIAERDTGTETRQLQQEIVDDLQELINLARHRQPQPQSSPKKPPQPKDESQQRPTPSAGEQPEHGSPQPQQGKAEDSEETLRKSRLKKFEIARRRKMVEDIWGHLPARMRKRLLNIAGEKYLPKYENLVRRYFEALVEKGQQESSINHRNARTGAP